MGKTLADFRCVTIGDCTLYQGDCMEIMPLLGLCADVLFTDPPYKMEIHGRGFAAKREYYSKLDYGTTTEFELSALFFEHALTCISEKSAVFCCNKQMLRDILNVAADMAWNYDILAMCKSSPAPLTNNQWLPDKEFAVHMFKSLPVRGSYATKRTWSISTNFKNPDTTHPSAKPVRLLIPIIENITDEGATVLDTFMGSASAALACLRTRRKFIGIERDELHFDEAVRRVRGHYEAGPLFEEIAA
jgi:site-specific DNA-methyltransferase (adenine-specific)